MGSLTEKERFDYEHRSGPTKPNPILNSIKEGPGNPCKTVIEFFGELTCNKSWNLEQALYLIRALQPKARLCGYHLLLGGGVLNNGSSNHDLDLVAMPGSHDPQDEDSLLEAFASLGYQVRVRSLEHPGIRLFKLRQAIDLVIPILDKREIEE